MTWPCEEPPISSVFLQLLRLHRQHVAHHITKSRMVFYPQLHSKVCSRFSSRELSTSCLCSQENKKKMERGQRLQLQCCHLLQLHHVEKQKWVQGIDHKVSKDHNSDDFFGQHIKAISCRTYNAAGHHLIGTQAKFLLQFSLQPIISFLTIQNSINDSWCSGIPLFEVPIFFKQLLSLLY